jgi:hypothetical protein
MFGYVEAPRTYRKAQTMARAAGVDLTAAVIDGWLRRDELARLLARCDRCGLSEACTGWHFSARPAALPDDCRVKSDLEALAAN